MIDEKELLTEVAKVCPECYGIVANVVNRMATVEVVRCKECTIRYTACPMVVRQGNSLRFFSEDDDYCSYGKGREDATD